MNLLCLTKQMTNLKLQGCLSMAQPALRYPLNASLTLSVFQCYLFAKFSRSIPWSHYYTLIPQRHTTTLHMPKHNILTLNPACLGLSQFKKYAVGVGEGIQFPCLPVKTSPNQNVP